MQQLRNEAAAGSPGRAYFSRKQQQDTVQAEVERKKAAYAGLFHGIFSKEASENRINKLLPKEVRGGSGEMVLNAAYLIRQENIKIFHQKVEQLEQEYESEGIYLQCTGPWPPYNFSPLSKGDAAS